MIEDTMVRGWQRAIDNEMSGWEFEQFCSDFLCAIGFFRADVTPMVDDGGIDIVAVKDDVTYAIQCKRQGGPIGPGAVRSTMGSRDFYESMGCHCDHAVVMTSSGFTERARQTAASLGVLLWDRAWIEERADDMGILLL